MLIAARYGCGDETVGVRLGSINLSIGTSVFETLEPRKINVKVVLIGKSVRDLVDEGVVVDDLLGHAVESSLNTGRLVSSKDLECDITS